MASMQCIKQNEKPCDRQQEQLQTVSHEKAVSVTRCNCQTNGPQSQAHVDQTKNPAPVAMPSHEKNEKKMKDKKENKDKKEKKGKKDKKEKKSDDKKKEKSGDKKK